MQDEMREPSRAEVAERMTSRIANSLVLAAGILGIAIYASGGGSEPPRYQVVATPDGRVVRVNTDNGSIVSCDAVRCTLIHLRGDDLDRASRPPPPAQPALPAPSPAPAQKAAPASEQPAQPKR